MFTKLIDVKFWTWRIHYLELTNHIARGQVFPYCEWDIRSSWFILKEQSFAFKCFSKPILVFTNLFSWLNTAPSHLVSANHFWVALLIVSCLDVNSGQYYFQIITQPNGLDSKLSWLSFAWEQCCKITLLLHLNIIKKSQDN